MGPGMRKPPAMGARGREETRHGGRVDNERMSGEKEQLERAERELAQLRSLVKDALGQLGQPDDDVDVSYEEGWAAAAGRIRDLLIPATRPSQRQELIDQTAVCVGLEPGGRCTGHLERLWDAAYKEGARNALTAGPLL